MSRSRLIHLTPCSISHTFYLSDPSLDCRFTRLRYIYIIYIYKDTDVVPLPCAIAELDTPPVAAHSTRNQHAKLGSVYVSLSAWLCTCCVYASPCLRCNWLTQNGVGRECASRQIDAQATHIHPDRSTLFPYPQSQNHTIRFTLSSPVTLQPGKRSREPRPLRVLQLDTRSSLFQTVHSEI